MYRLTLDPELKVRLKDVAEHVELCDEHGNVVGHVLPARAYDDLFYASLAAESPHSKEELRRRHQDTAGRSLAEIWKSLGRT